MKKYHTFSLALLFATSFLSYRCDAQPTHPALAEAKAAIAKSNAVYFQAFVKGDPSIFVNRYAKDCLIMAPGMPAIKGQSGALTFFKKAYDEIGLRNSRFITTDVFGDGKGYVTEAGLWQSFDAHGKMFDDGKFLVLWKKTPKGWKMFRDSFSSNHNK